LSGKSSSKKIMLYAVIGILAVAAVSVSLLGGNNSQQQVTQNVEDSRKQAIENFKIQFCGPNPKANSNAFVTEYVLPTECEMPLGMTADGQKAYYVSTKNGAVGYYDTEKAEFSEHLAPNWPTRSSPTEFSMVWAAKQDSSGNIWFTDDKAGLIWKFTKSTGDFVSFQSPVQQPISLDFDSDGNMYLVGVRSKSLYYGEVAKMNPGTADGFTEIKLPLDGFANATDFKISSGSVAVDKQRNVVWTSILAFQEKGQIFSYKPSTGEIMVYDLPPELNSPVGMAVDNDGRLWVTDHGTSIFFMLDPATGGLTRYTTAVASDRIFGGLEPEGSYTLPYWIQAAPDGSIWFNQHVGNKIAKFDSASGTLTEYWIPTQNPNWQNCPDNAASCGLANALQFTVGSDGQVWFSEWTENKIGRINPTAIPFSISAQDEITVSKGSSAEVKVTVNASDDVAGKMTASATFVNTGSLGKSAGIFSESNVSLTKDSSKQVSYVFTPADDLAPGKYVLMLGLDTGEVSVLKAIRVTVV